MLHFVLLVQPVYHITLVFHSTSRVSLTDNFADVVNLWLELIDGLLGVLVSQGFSFFALPNDKLILSRLEIFIVTSVELLLVDEDLACVTDRRMERVRITAIHCLVLHSSHGHLRFHISFNTRVGIIVESINHIIVLHLMVPFD